MIAILTALALQSGWKTFASAAEGYSVKLPASSELKTMSFADGGVNVKVKTYVAKVEAGFYQFTVMTPSRALTANERKNFLRGLNSTYLKNLGGTLKSRGAGKLAGHAGEKSLFTVAGNPGEYWNIPTARHIFVVTAVGLKKNLEEAKKPFFGSLKLG